MASSTEIIDSVSAAAALLLVRRGLGRQQGDPAAVGREQGHPAAVHARLGVAVGLTAVLLTPPSGPGPLPSFAVLGPANPDAGPPVVDPFLDALHLRGKVTARQLTGGLLQAGVIGKDLYGAPLNADQRALLAFAAAVLSAVPGGPAGPASGIAGPDTGVTADRQAWVRAHCTLVPPAAYGAVTAPGGLFGQPGPLRLRVIR